MWSLNLIAPNSPRHINYHDIGGVGHPIAKTEPDGLWIEMAMILFYTTQKLRLQTVQERLLALPKTFSGLGGCLDMVRGGKIACGVSGANLGSIQVRVELPDIICRVLREATHVHDSSTIRNCTGMPNLSQKLALRNSACS